MRYNRKIENNCNGLLQAKKLLQNMTSDRRFYISKSLKK